MWRKWKVIFFPKWSDLHVVSNLRDKYATVAFAWWHNLHRCHTSDIIMICYKWCWTYLGRLISSEQAFMVTSITHFSENQKDKYLLLFQICFAHAWCSKWFQNYCMLVTKHGCSGFACGFSSEASIFTGKKAKLTAVTFLQFLILVFLLCWQVCTVLLASSRC